MAVDADALLTGCVVCGDDEDHRDERLPQARHVATAEDGAGIGRCRGEQQPLIEMLAKAPDPPLLPDVICMLGEQRSQVWPNLIMRHGRGRRLGARHEVSERPARTHERQQSLQEGCAVRLVCGHAKQEAGARPLRPVPVPMLLVHSPGCCRHAGSEPLLLVLRELGGVQRGRVYVLGHPGKYHSGVINRGLEL